MLKPAGEDAARRKAPSSVRGTSPEQRAASADPTRGARDPGDLTGAGRQRLRVGLVALVFLGLLAGLYAGIVRDLAWQGWDDPDYTHVLLVPLFSGFLVWQRRSQLAVLPANGSWIGLPVLLAGTGELLLGDMGSENFLMRSSLILVLAGLVLLHLGRESFRALAFPLLFLFFMIPPPATLLYAVTFPLQNLAARSSVWMLDLLGVPVVLDGNVIHLARLSLGVTEACSGIRSLISLLTVVTGWAALSFPGRWAGMGLVAAVIPITLFANSVRVVATGLLGQSFGIEYAEGFFHIFTGWLLFVFAFACLVVIHGLLRWAASIRPCHRP